LLNIDTDENYLPLSDKMQEKLYLKVRNRRSYTGHHDIDTQESKTLLERGSQDDLKQSILIFRVPISKAICTCRVILVIYYLRAILARQIFCDFSSFEIKIKPFKTS
jgi:hypothetical protein